jgi:hypothetical protein
LRQSGNFSSVIPGRAKREPGISVSRVRSLCSRPE